MCFFDGTFQGEIDIPLGFDGIRWQVGASTLPDPHFEFTIFHVNGNGIIFPIDLDDGSLTVILQMKTELGGNATMGNEYAHLSSPETKIGGRLLCPHVGCPLVFIDFEPADFVSILIHAGNILDSPLSHFRCQILEDSGHFVFWMIAKGGVVGVDCDCDIHCCGVLLLIGLLDCHAVTDDMNVIHFGVL